MLKSRTLALLGTSALAGTLLFAAPATASAKDTQEVTCTGGTLTINVAANGNATGTGTLTGCTSPTHPELLSATVTVTGHATVSNAVLAVISSTDTITWNTGQTTTLTMEREYFGAANFIETGEGASIDGLLHPAVAAQAATGKRTLTTTSRNKNSKAAPLPSYTLVTGIIPTNFTLIV